MDWPVEVMASQLAQDWEELMLALSAVLGWTVSLGVLAIALGSVIAASCRTVRPRRFWCPSAGRDVEVLFEEWGPPGFRQTLRVAECSAFEPASRGRLSARLQRRDAPSSGCVPGARGSDGIPYLARIALSVHKVGVE